MREKVMSLAQGKFTYEQPELLCSVDHLTLNVAEGGEETSVFCVSNAAGSKVKGFGAAEDFDVDFLPVFDGKENELTVKVRAGNHRAGETWKGELALITDCGEAVVPYEIHVTARCFDSSIGKINSYERFVELARQQFDEAVLMFYHEKFADRLLNTWEEKRLYQNLTLKNSKKQALEEFLVTHGDKDPVRFAADIKQLSFEVCDEDITGEITITREGWGMAGMKAVSKSPLLSLDRESLCETDFAAGQMAVTFRISAGQVPAGIHHSQIVFENVYQTIEIGVCIHGVKGRERRLRRVQWERTAAKLTESHILYLMNSSRKEAWTELLLEKKEEILSVAPEQEQLLEGYLAVLRRTESKERSYANAVEGMTPPKAGESQKKVMRYLAFRYVRCLALRSEEQNQTFCGELYEYYTNGYENWRLLVMLERLGYFQGNPAGLWEELNRLWSEGSSSPYMQMYRMLLILQEPDLLKRLDPQTIATLRFGLKHDLITEDVVIAVSLLAARQKRLTPALLSLLEGCYEMFENPDTLQSICALLIRSEKLKNKYFRWFRLGVEKRLRMTELFEYYMYTMPKEKFREALPEVMTYFQYENHLRDSVKVSFYAGILRNRQEHPEYFHIYSNAIREFTLKQLYEHHISTELAVLYETFLSEENCRDRIAKELPYILFTHHLVCNNKNMERVVVVHDEGAGESVYNLTNGEGDILIGTPNYRLYFVDKSGFYHASTVSYQLHKMLNLDFMSWACYENGSEHPMLLLHLFSEALRAEQTGAKDAILLHMMIRKQIPGMEYTQKALQKLYEYYKTMEEDSLLEEVMLQLDFEYLTPEKRAGVLQTMIQHKRKEEALKRQRKYGILNGSRKLLLLLITQELEEGGGGFEPYDMKLCYFLYRHGVKNKRTLAYLVDYYMGRTESLLTIYRDALREETDISDGGTERLLGQALFAGRALEEFFDIFMDYYEYGANRILVKAFLNDTAYEFLVGRCGLSGEVREKIQREGLSEDNHLMILAMLRYYAGQSEYTQSEREYIEHHLEVCVSEDRVFDFMKEFAGKLEVPFAVMSEERVQFYCSCPGDIYIETEDAEGEKTLQPMRCIFDDIYTYETLLFRGETLRYRIFAGSMQNSVKEGVLEKNDASAGREQGFYDMVNEMIEAKEKGDQERYRSLVRRYQSRQKASEKLLAPLS